MVKLASAAVSIGTQGDPRPLLMRLISVTGNFQEAYLTYGDVQVQCCEGEELDGAASILLLNGKVNVRGSNQTVGKSVANMERRHWDEALEDLQKAYQQDPKDIDTVANLVTCCKWLKQEKDYQNYLSYAST